MPRSFLVLCFFGPLIVLKRAKPATKREMTQFHSDEYVEFLSRITPSNMNSFVKEQHKCISFLFVPTEVAKHEYSR